MPTSDIYQENPDHVPDLADQVGTLDTSGTSGVPQSDMRRMSPVFELARQRELEDAQRALDPEDAEVPANLVTLPADTSSRGLVEDRIGDAQTEAVASVEAPYGSPAHFEAEDEAKREEGAVATSAHEHEANVQTGPDPFFTDLTGTLDTSGTALTGHPNADDISTAAQAQVEEADGEGDVPRPVKKATKAKKAAKKS